LWYNITIIIADVTWRHEMTGQTEEEEGVHVGALARALGVSPATLSQALYSRRVVGDDILSQCPIVRGRRVIPRRLIAQLLTTLASRGYIPRIS
jgi:hypothetical protein